jgi:glutamate-1-semialdehyde 2,1-aminomutase
MNMEKSEKLYRKARNLLPGGVSSPVRAIKPYPFYTVRAEGSKLYDVDGNEYIDYCMGYGPLILGHRNPTIQQAIAEQMEKGWLYGTPTPSELDMAQMIADAFESIEMVRFVNSGSEATMSALRIARGFTGKEKVIKIEGGFHGAHDAVLVKAGSGATTHGVPNSMGVPVDFVKNTLQVPYNDVEALIELIEKNRDNVACLIMEPVMGNSGLILPKDGYLKEVRRVTEENDVLLIFDEVITGFRVSYGGAQDYYGVHSDLTTLGKIAGGGLPFGIVGGKEEIMEHLSPSGKVYQAGTFNGNPLVLAAGLATLRFLRNNDVYGYLEQCGKELNKGINDTIHDLKLEYNLSSLGSMFCLFFGETPGNYEEALQCDKDRFLQFFYELLKEGIFFPPSQYETCFISYAHETEDIQKTIEAVHVCLKRL